MKTTEKIINTAFKIGDSVKWTSNKISKKGKVLCIIKKGVNPFDVKEFRKLCETFSYHRMKNLRISGSVRDSVGYVILVGTKMYFPIVKKLLKCK